MPRRKIRDEADARRCLRSLEESGLTLREWALEHWVDGRSLRAWGNNLARRHSSAAPARLVELVANERSGKASGWAAGPRYVVRVAGVEVEVGDDFRQETLLRLLEVVAC